MPPQTPALPPPHPRLMSREREDDEITEEIDSAGDLTTALVCVLSLILP